MTWTSRDLTVAECAAMSGLHRANIDIIIHRAKSCEVLFSERRKHRRWFSPRDICVLRIAHELERAGRTWLTAIAQAFQHLEHPPPADSMLIVPVMSVAGTSGRIITGGEAEVHVAGSTVLIPIGRICADIMARCAELKEPA